MIDHVGAQRIRETQRSAGIIADKLDRRDSCEVVMLITVEVTCMLGENWRSIYSDSLPQVKSMAF